MKIYTITCQHVYNYGASLQAYALQKYLEENKHDVKIIDYRLPEHHRYELRTIFNSPLKTSRIYKLMRKFPPLVLAYPIYSLSQMLITYGRKIKFDRFDKEFLHLTKKRFNNIEQLRSSEMDCDILVAGSDQIWNTKMRNGTDDGYYLNFWSPSIKRISYAASFGISEIEDGKKQWVTQALKKFNHISVREATGVKILQDLGYEGELVLDPVFLLSRNEWIRNLNLLQKKNSQESYILLYDFSHADNEIKEFAKKISLKTGLPIFSLNDLRNVDYANKQINNAGPREFIELINNAAYVVSNSFHATAFSIIFEKEFATFPFSSQQNSSRMTDLLKTVGLSERFRPTSIDVFFEHKIEWVKIEEQLANVILKSKAYLNNAINC